MLLSNDLFCIIIKFILSRSKVTGYYVGRSIRFDSHCGNRRPACGTVITLTQTWTQKTSVRLLWMSERSVA